MSYAMANEVTSARRPRPGPGRDRATGYQVAPPVTEAYTPWVTILEPSEADGDLRWATGPDGVLLPVRAGANADSSRAVRRAVLARLAALARR
jgi:hypothetical protein